MSKNTLDNRIRALEEKLSGLGYASKTLAEDDSPRQYKIPQQVQTLNAPIIGYVIDTIDPLKLNRVRFFSPFLHDPDTKIKDLPFARAVNPFGGHDDCGLTWVPPAGSTIVVLHENGDRKAPMYIGTTWHADRGPDGRFFPYPILEYQKLFCDRGEGYLVGDVDGSQVYPPWNTENYNGLDLESEEQIERDPEAQRKITYPNIYGFKSPGKHWFKMVDGDYRCQNHWKRVEWGSACGQWMMFKDDWLHPGGQWANAAGGGGGGGGSTFDDCLDISPFLEDEAQGQEDQFGDFIGPQVGNCISNNKGQQCRDLSDDSPQPQNPYFKRSEECRPYRGAATPQNNKLRLPQSGIQMQSRSGHQMVLDDAVEQPEGKKCDHTKEFGFGCTNVAKMKMFFKSATGHLVEVNDKEDIPNIRNKDNGFKVKTAAGHIIKACDHTIEGEIAGEDREIRLQTTSNHMLVMNDNGNKQASPQRREGGVPTSKATNAYIMLRSGYGLLVRMDDDFSQEETQQQAITIIAPRKDGSEAGAAPGGAAADAGAPETEDCKQGHIMRMQIDQQGGYIVTCSGGYYITTSVKDNITEVGRKDCKANMVQQIFGNYLVQAEKAYLLKSEIELHIADKYIILGAGKDCPVDPDKGDQTAEEALTAANEAVGAEQNGETSKKPKEMAPCFYPVIVAKKPWACPFTGQIHWTHKSMSDRVIASASNN